MEEAYIPRQEISAQRVSNEEVHVLGADALKLTFDFDTDDDFEDLWSDEIKTSEQQAADNKSDLIVQYHAMGVEIPEGEDWDGVTAADMREWYGGLKDGDRTYADLGRERHATIQEQAHEVKTELAKSAPELLIGRLPVDLEQLVGDTYQLGINQSGPDSPTEAQELLDQYNGINMGMYGTNLDQRFLIVDNSMPDAAEDAAVYGYYGHREGSPASGKFVAVLPGEDYHSDLPSDFWVSNGTYDGNLYQGSQSANAKYIAGFIDEHGSFHRNNNFMQSEVPSLVSTTNVHDQDSDWL